MTPYTTLTTRCARQTSSLDEVAREVEWPATFIRREEFCSLLVSSRRMARSDLPSANVRGLMDLATGEWFLIEEDELFA